MKKIIKNALIITLLLMLGLSTAALAYLHFFTQEVMDVSGEWAGELDMTEQAAMTALAWLQDIEAVPVSLEDMGAYMQNLTVQVRLNMKQTAQGEGTFQCSVLPESYEICSEAAYEAFAGAFHMFLAERLRMAGYEGSTDREALEVLVTESFGMSTVSYLRSCVPDLLPALEELQAQYDGNGTYGVQEDILSRQFDNDTPVAARTERCIRSGVTLILSEEVNSAVSASFYEYYPIVYTLKQPQNQ